MKLKTVAMSILTMTSCATAAPAVGAKLQAEPKVVAQKPSNLAANRRASYVRSKSFEPKIVEIEPTRTVRITARSKSFNLALNDSETRLLAFPSQRRSRRVRENTFRRSNSFAHGERSFDKYERNMESFRNYLEKIGEI